MTAFQWFQSYTDAVSTAACLLLCTDAEQTRAFWSRTMLAYRSAKGAEYADSLAVQVDALLEGVDAMRKGAVP